MSQAGLIPRMPGFSARSFSVRLLVEEVGLAQFLSEYFLFRFQYYFTSAPFHMHLHSPLN